MNTCPWNDISGPNSTTQLLSTSFHIWIRVGLYTEVHVLKYIPKMDKVILSGLPLCHLCCHGDSVLCVAQQGLLVHV